MQDLQKPSDLDIELLTQFGYKRLANEDFYSKLNLDFFQKEHDESLSVFDFSRITGKWAHLQIGKKSTSRYKSLPNLMKKLGFDPLVIKCTIDTFNAKHGGTK